ncbi:hypothetical protein [Parabacteroides johnsonii]|uniref:hypothetical protein n=1 Tax=Parabacteroides johnsonii TaxID=387661 RepID=UPI00243231C7|nr:hypothetical protein [Parabacteroides johnsonii]
MIGLNKIGLNQVQLNRLYLNAPFPVYRKMAGGGSSGDGFPVLPGDVTRWHFGGLTNEMMAAMDDPRIEDADHKGRFLSFKNFLWAKMSGVGGYEFDFKNSSDWVVNSTQIKEYNDNRIVISNRLNIVQLNYKHTSIKITLKVTGLEENGTTLDIYDNVNSSKTQRYNKDGIYEIDYTANEGATRIFIYAGGGKLGELDVPIIIEQLPLYPGFILGDGVDDFAVTEKELNFQDTYTVYTAFIPFQDDPARNMVLCGKDIKDFYINYSSLRALSFYSGNKAVSINLSNGFNLLCCKRNLEKMTIKNLITGDSVTATANDLIDNPGLYYLWRVTNGYTYSKAAIAGQIIDNGHFTTDEEDEKVLNWHKKQYPWLFPDQAWTVVGKTNEDEDRATIANITGNGNNLVLSNFGFTENSGYGLYTENYSPWRLALDRVQVTRTHNSFNTTSVSSTVVAFYYQSSSDENPFTIPSYKIRVTGLIDGQSILYRVSDSIYSTIDSDGIYVLPSIEFNGMGGWYGFSYGKIQESCDITIEQIPEYEGYLVTDGVDDKIMSSAFTMGKDFTAVGEWAIIDEIDSRSGISKDFSLKILGKQNGLWLFINDPGNSIVIETKSLKAVCSDGRVYLNDWIEVVSSAKQRTPGSNNSMDIGFVYNDFAQMVFKNLAIYPTVLSKEDCIKAYNYLQTLKAKI